MIKALKIKTFRGHKSNISSIAICQNKKLLMSAGALERTINIWSCANGKQVKIFRGHSDWIKSIAISPNDIFIISGSCDSTIIIWNIQSGE